MEEWIAFVFSALRKYYSSKFGQSKEFNSQFAGEIFGEALFNAVGHGNRFHPEKLTKLGVWLGSKGTIFAIEDEGNFFKDESIKNKILSRSHIKSTATQETGGGGTGGLEYIYQTDEIAIEGNTLFLMVTANRFFE